MKQKELTKTFIFKLEDKYFSVVRVNNLFGSIFVLVVIVSLCEVNYYLCLWLVLRFISLK